jgi:hypothetical protein
MTTNNRAAEAQPSPKLLASAPAQQSEEVQGKPELACIALSPASMNLHDLCKAAPEEAVEAYLQQLSADAADDLAFVLELKNELRYSPLHVSIFARWKL